MKNIITILSDLGITVPEDQNSALTKAVAENYKTIAEHTKVVDKLTAMTERAEAAENTLKGFEGKDFDAIIKDRDEWKRKHDELVESHRKEDEDREFSGLLDAAISDAKGKNAKAITALLDVDALKKSRNQKSDIEAALDSLRTEHGYLFDDNGGTPYFSKPKGGGAVGDRNGTYSIGELMRMKNENPGLDISKYLSQGG